MMKTYSYTLALLMLILLPSCKQTQSEKLEKLLREWTGKEIVFPNNPSFTIYGEQEADFKIPTDGYKVVHYLDSIGCISCKLNLEKWKEYIAYMDSATNGTVPCVFFFHAKEKREVKISLKEDNFDYPVCMDTANEFYQLNRFPMYPILQTFLLDKDNRIVDKGTLLEPDKRQAKQTRTGSYTDYCRDFDLHHSLRFFPLGRKAGYSGDITEHRKETVGYPRHCHLVRMHGSRL